ncbi:MAG: hypothetical protein Q8L14_15965 [Myxococcales bacterium]|nr:hypothetical protein [Myxococcales bacterium]
MNFRTALLSVIVTGCSGTPPCGPSTCATGCCAMGQCVAGTELTQCGAGGNACDICVANQQCIMGRCGAADAGAVELPAGRTVEVTRTDEYLLADGGVLKDVVDLGAKAATARLLSPTDGGFLELRAVVEPGNALVFQRVPAGPYLVLRDDTWVSSDDDFVDLGIRVWGHQRRRISQRNTTLSITATLSAQLDGGLLEGDFLWASSANAGTIVEQTRWLPPTLGERESTAVADLFVQRGAWGMSGAEGDVLEVSLLRTVAWSIGTYSATRASALVRAPDISSGNTATVSATLVPVTLRRVPLRFQVSDFEGFVSQAHPSAVRVWAGVTVAAFPRATIGSLGDFIGRSAGLANTGFAQPSGGALDDQVEVPTLRDNTSTVLSVGTLQVTVPFVVATRRFDREVEVVVTTDQPGTLLNVTLSPPSNVRLNGVSATTDRTNVGTTPLLEWQAPAVGTAAMYDVVISRLEAGTPVNEFVVARLRTPFTAVRIPPRLLTAGQPHFATVTATSIAGVDVKRWPMRSRNVNGRSTTITSLFTP